MKSLILIALLGAAGWYVYVHHPARVRDLLGIKPAPSVRLLPEQFTCDGRIYCSQMTSCQEAKFFLAHCPRTKLDAEDSGGIPCQKQWCK